MTMSDISYEYAVGRIKAREGRILNRATWNRLLEANGEEALKILQESGYGSDADDQTRIEALIDAEVTQTQQLIAGISPDPDLTNLFLYPTDGYNLKIILKGILQRTDVKDLLHEGGTIPLEVLLASVEDEPADALPEPFKEALEKLEGVEDPRLISLCVDQAVYQCILDELTEHKNLLLIQYFQAKIDFTNILTIVRGNALHWDVAQVTRLLLEGGQLEKRILTAAIGLEPDQLPKALAVGDFSDAIKGALDNYASHHNIGELEQQLDNVPLSIIHEARSDSFGIGPILNYLLLKEREAQALRVLFAGKRAGMSLSLAELGIE